MKQNIVIFGASKLGETALLFLQPQYSVQYFCDNDPKKWGTYFHKKKVIAPNDLKEIKNTVIVITSSHYRTIAKQLLAMGIDYFRIFKVELVSNYLEGLSVNNTHFEFYGNEYGGYAVIPELIKNSSTVYSFGIGTDMTFDTSLIQKHDINVYAFDPTPKSIQWVRNQALPEQFRFYEWGVSDYNGNEKWYLPDDENHVSCTINDAQYHSGKYIEAQVRTLKSIMEKLGHKKLDVLKLDIEGAEYKVLNNILKDGIEVTQILVEFHHRFNNIGWPVTENMINELKLAGYRLFFISNDEEVFSFVNMAYSITK